MRIILKNIGEMIIETDCNKKNIDIINEPTIENKDTSKEITIELPTKRYRNMLDKWIKKNNITKFSIKQFIKDNPKQRYSSYRINNYLSQMITDKTLTQISNDTFMVNKIK